MRMRPPLLPYFAALSMMLRNPPYWELEIHEQDAISLDDEEDVIYTYTIGDLIEKLSNTIISDYEFRVTIKNHSTESVFIEDEVIEDLLEWINDKIKMKLLKTC